MTSCFPEPAAARRIRRAATAGIFLSMALASSLQAQWPTSYLQPRELTSGHNLVPLDVLSRPDGTVVAAHAVTSDTETRMTAVTLDRKGAEVGQWMFYNNGIPVRSELFPVATAPEDFVIGLKSVRMFAEEPANPFVVAQVRPDGTEGIVVTGWQITYEGGAISPSGKIYHSFCDPVTRQVSIIRHPSGHPALGNLGQATASQFYTLVTRDDNALAAFTREGLLDMTLSEVCLHSVNTSGGLTATPIVKAGSQPGYSQHHPKLIQINDEKVALTWLASRDKKNSLYANIVSTSGTALNSIKLIQENVANYVVTNSSLGIPVYAFTKRNYGVTPPVDTLYGGLLDAENGISLNLPFATGSNILTKEVRQEANGDFSLIYSVRENGTNLLKVRRISGLTATTLWETTVADLGQASDEFVDEYPNTAVSGRNNVLHIITRQDQIFSTENRIHIARLTADGQLGPDQLVAPTNLQAPTRAPGHVQLTWDDPNDAETHFIIARSDTDITAAEILGAVDADATTYIDTTAEAGRTYQYYVASFQGDTGNFVISAPLQVEVSELPL